MQGLFLNGILEIAITTQTPPHKLDCIVHEFIVGKLVFKAIKCSSHSSENSVQGNIYFLYTYMS